MSNISRIILLDIFWSRGNFKLPNNYMVKLNKLKKGLKVHCELKEKFMKKCKQNNDKKKYLLLY